MRWGRIVNMCSLAMKTGGITAGTAYTTSKGGLAALTFSLAREFASFGVTVNGISPAYIKTPMVTEFLSKEQQSGLLEQIPVGRFCEPAEVANVVRFLVSPLSGFITGEIIDINGGLHMDCFGSQFLFRFLSAGITTPLRLSLKRSIDRVQKVTCFRYRIFENYSPKVLLKMSNKRKQNQNPLYKQASGTYNMVKCQTPGA